jgi:hypothetical protein
MARTFDVGPPLERAYTRESMLAVELLDAVTLERVSRGLEVRAEGLAGPPIVNHGGLHVWLKQDITQFTRLVIETRALPFERVEIPAAQVNRPLHRVELRPLPNYPFSPGITALRGSLYETDVPPGQVPQPVRASVRLEWLDDDNTTWHPWHSPVPTNAAGDFTAIQRFARGQYVLPTDPMPMDQAPQLDALGRMTVRLFAKRAAGPERLSSDFQLAQGRVSDETFAWDELS